MRKYANIDPTKNSLWAKACDDFLSGAKVKDLAAMFGVSPKRMRRYLMNDEDLSNRSTLKKFTLLKHDLSTLCDDVFQFELGQIKIDIDKGLSRFEIADVYGLSSDAVDVAIAKVSSHDRTCAAACEQAEDEQQMTNLERRKAAIRKDAAEKKDALQLEVYTRYHDDDLTSVSELMKEFNASKDEILSIIFDFAPQGYVKTHVRSSLGEDALAALEEYGDEIVRKFTAGMSISALSEAYDIAHSYVRDYVKSALGDEYDKRLEELRRKRNANRAYACHCDEIIERFMNGESVGKLADAYKIDRIELVERLKKALGVEYDVIVEWYANRHHRVELVTEEQLADIVTWFLDGRSINWISNHVGLSLGVVRSELLANLGETQNMSVRACRRKVRCIDAAV